MNEDKIPQDGQDKAPFFISSNGTWFYQGSPISRKSLVKLFASVLRREEDGSFWLVTPVERVAVAVADAPFMVIRANRTNSGSTQKLELFTNTDDTIVVDVEHPIYVETNPATGEPAPYAIVRNGLRGRITRSVFYDLVIWSEEEPESGEYFLRSMGEKFVIGRATTDVESTDA